MRAPSVGIFLAIGALAFATPGIPAPADPHCTGDTYHDQHNWTTGCKLDNNPHFGHVPWSTTCESSASGQNNCTGCYACCNGRLDQQVECACQGRIQCELSAQSSRDACIGNCIGAYEGAGCGTNTEFRL